MSARNRKRLIDAELAACERRLADPDVPAGEKLEEAARRERLLDQLEELLWEIDGREEVEQSEAEEAERTQDETGGTQR